MKFRTLVTFAVTIMMLLVAINSYAFFGGGGHNESPMFPGIEWGDKVNKGQYEPYEYAAILHRDEGVFKPWKRKVGFEGEQYNFINKFYVYVDDKEKIRRAVIVSGLQYSMVRDLVYIAFGWPDIINTKKKTMAWLYPDTIVEFKHSNGYNYISLIDPSSDSTFKTPERDFFFGKK